MEKKNLGYDDTPTIPGSTFKVHDGTRPQPRIVRPGTASTQQQAGDPPFDDADGAGHELVALCWCEGVGGG